jgi:hypothetical protein
MLSLEIYVLKFKDYYMTLLFNSIKTTIAILSLLSSN